MNLLMMLVTVFLMPASGMVETETDQRSVQFTFKLGKRELDKCASGLLREAETLTYTCELSIPLKGKNAKFKNLVSPNKVRTFFGGAQREVLVEVSDDAKVLSLTTSFDPTGIDLELSKFNDDFFDLYAQSAHAIISNALKKQSVKIEILR